MVIVAAARMASLAFLRALQTWRSDLRATRRRKPRRFDTLPDSLRDDVGLDFWPR